MKKKEVQDTTKIFRALAVEKRREIVQILAERTLCVGALSNLLGISAGAVSQHLRILKDAGLVEADRRGYFIHYSIAPDAAERCRITVNSLFGVKSKSKKRRQEMCHGKQKCERPKELKGKAEACSPEQVKKCHGDVKEHPCSVKPNKSK